MGRENYRFDRFLRTNFSSSTIQNTTVDAAAVIPSSVKVSGLILKTSLKNGT